VSEANARSWRRSVDVDRVVPNGIDLQRWRFGAHADATRAVWTGRVVPEKGAHLAIEAAHAAGLRIDVAGPVHDQAYFDEHVAPLLAPGDRFLGHLDHDRLAAVVAAAGAALITPCWDEPYGLVVAEALACGTPVAAFARGAIPEIVDATCARPAPAGDVAALGEAARAALALDRRACRDRAERHCSDEVMADRPFGEQRAKAAALRRTRTAVVRGDWPAAARWPAVLDEALALGDAGARLLCDGRGAERAAAFLDAQVAGRAPARRAPASSRSVGSRISSRRSPSQATTPR
jgi:glycosyltransferase involved in cell wall biosynthesis